MEKIYLVSRSQCFQQQQTLLESGFIIGKRRICKYCGKGFTINKINLIRQVK